MKWCFGQSVDPNTISWQSWAQCTQEDSKQIQENLGESLLASSSMMVSAVILRLGRTGHTTITARYVAIVVIKR